jgi:hypothetical protein
MWNTRRDMHERTWGSLVPIIVDFQLHRRVQQEEDLVDGMRVSTGRGACAGGERDMTYGAGGSLPIE